MMKLSTRNRAARVAMLAAGTLLALASTALQAGADADARAREIYAELVAIDTSRSAGSTTAAAEAMARRLREAGLPAADIEVTEPWPRQGNLVARLRGTGAQKPLLLLAHIDVVEAAATEWTVPPFALTEKDGYFYGRGSADDKAMAAIWVANLIGYLEQGWKPSRDIIVALTANEESEDNNGIGWLLANRPELREAEFCLNEGGGGTLLDGKPVNNGIQVAEKLYQSYRIEAEGPGGHSSRPTPENPIYRLAAGLSRIEAHRFPVNLNDGTREYFRQQADLREGIVAADMRAILEQPIDPVAVERLSEKSEFNGLLRTTCVATRIEGGHADNALPMRATATVNCRILPQEKVEDITRALARVLADDKLLIRPVAEAIVSPPSPLDPRVMDAARSITAQMWPGVPLIPVMSTGFTDGARTRNAGIPTYGISGAFTHANDTRAHGRDERLPVKAFFESREFLDRLVKALAQ